MPAFISKIRFFSLLIQTTLAFIFVLHSYTAQALVITSASFNPASIAKGGSSTLTWTTNGAISCSIGGQSVGFNGSKTYTNVTTSGQVTITCFAPQQLGGGSTSRSATLTVISEPPVPLSVATLLPVTASATIPYSAEANSMGDAEIRIPVDVVPGVNGHQPKLAISYNSNRMRKLANEGWEEDNLGTGWRLAGLSSIRACGKSNLAAIDPLDFGPNQFTPMCLDGQLFVQNKPMPIDESGNSTRGQTLAPWSSQDHEYVLFDDNGIKIRASGQTAVGAGGNYKVYYPDGSVSEYGFTPDSRLKQDYIIYKKYNDPLDLTYRDNNPANHIHTGSSHYNERRINSTVYFINKHTDAFGNEIRYEYLMDEGMAFVMPKRILYGPQKTPDTIIEFGYQKRAQTGATDSVSMMPPVSDSTSMSSSDYAAWLTNGYRLSSAIAINKLTVKHNNQPITEYNLVHEELQSGSRLARLKHIQKCGYKNNIRDCLNPLTITWDGDLTDKVLTRVKQISDNQGSWTQFDYQRVASGMSGVFFTESPFGAPPTQYTSSTQKPIPEPNTIYQAGEWEPSALVELRTSNGQGGTRTLRYRYLGEGIDSKKGWGFMGYHAVRIEDVNRGLFTYKQYSLDHRLIGRSVAEISLQGVYGSSGSKMLSKQITIRDSKFLYHGQYRFLGSANLIMGSPAHTWYNYPRQTIQFRYEDGQQVGVLVKEQNPEFTSWQNGPDTGFQYPFLRETTITRWASNATLSTGSGAAGWGVYTLSGVSGVQRSERVNVEYTENRNFDSLLISFPRETQTRVYTGDVTTTPEQTVTESRTPYIINGKPRSVIASHTRHVGNPDLESTTSYVYNSDGLKTSESLTGPSFSARTTSFGNFAARRYPQTITNALGQSITYRYDESGQTISSTDLNGLTTTTDYDAFGRVLVVTNSDGVSVTTRYDLCSTLGACPTVNGIAAFRRIKVTSPISPETSKYLDALGREIRVETRSFDGIKNVIVDTLYDAFGQVDKKSLPYFSGNTPRYIDQDYDILGRLIKTTNPDGSYKQITYGIENGQKRVTRTAYIKDSQGTVVSTKINKSYFNAIDEVVKTTDAADTPDQISTEFQYYATGLTKNIKVGGVQVASFVYDAAGNRTILNDQNAGTVTSAYNGLGQLRYSIDNAGQRKDYTYDLLGRPSTETTSDGVQRWFYDPANSIGGLNYTEFTDTRAGYYHKRTMGYYSNSKPSDINTEIRAPGFSIRTYNQHFTYDTYGRADTVSFPSGITVKSNYNSAGYLASVADTQGNSLQNITSVDVLGNVTQMSYGQGVTSARSYNPLTGALESVSTTAGSTSLQNNNFKWRSDGLMESRSTAIGQQRTERFNYDNLSRLTSATTTAGSSTRTTSTSYALNGNILSKTASNSVGNTETQATGFQYGTTTNAGPNAVSAVTVDGIYNSLYYNANGGITRYDASTGADRFVEWTARGNPWRLTKGTAGNDANPDARDEIAYGVNGERYFKKSTWKDSNNRQRTEYTFYVDDYEDLLTTNDPQFAQVERSRINDNVLHIRTKTHTGVIAKSIEFLHKDHLGSIEAITNINGQVLVQMSFDAFGSRRKTNWIGSLTNAETDTLLAKVGVGTSRGYTGHEHLDRTGFIHMNGRVYDPVLGRFLSPDPFVQSPYFSQSYNRYSYVWNNPVGATDPSGYLVSPLPNNGIGYRVRYDPEREPVQNAADNTQDTSASDSADNAQQSNVTAQTQGEALSQIERGDGNQNTQQESDVPEPWDGIMRETPKRTFGEKVEDALEETFRLAQGIPGEGVVVAGSIKLGTLLVGKAPSVVNKLPRFNGAKPSYHINPAHVPGSRGFNPRKTPLPNDSEAVFSNAVPNDPKSPTAWFGRNESGQIYRYSLGNDGTAHFSGIDGVGDGVRNLTKYAIDRLNGL